MTRTRRPSTRDAGFTAIELVVVIAIIAILVAVSTSGLMRARTAANEANAIESVRYTIAAQHAYAVVCGHGAYASGYLVLGQAPPGAEAGFIGMNLGGSAQPLVSGYRFTLTPGAGRATGALDCNGNATTTTFYNTAIPLSVIAGNRSFAMNADMVIWEREGGTAPVEPFGPPAAPIR